MHILFADDNRAICEMFETIFDLYGIETCVVHDGAQAVAAVEAVLDNSPGFDALLLDINMPVMNGWETLGAIRQLPQGQQIPIVLFTGCAAREDESRAVEAGADRLLTKPMLPQDLVRILRDLVQARQMRQAPVMVSESHN